LSGRCPRSSRIPMFTSPRAGPRLAQDWESAGGQGRADDGALRQVPSWSTVRRRRGGRTATKIWTDPALNLFCFFWTTCVKLMAVIWGNRFFGRSDREARRGRAHRLDRPIAGLISGFSNSYNVSIRRGPRCPRACGSSSRRAARRVVRCPVFVRTQIPLSAHLPRRFAARSAAADRPAA